MTDAQPMGVVAGHRHPRRNGAALVVEVVQPHLELR
jgi:hypothetical protein